MALVGEDLSDQVDDLGRRLELGARSVVLDVNASGVLASGGGRSERGPNDMVPGTRAHRLV